MSVLGKIENVLRVNNAPVLKFFQDGVNKEYIEQKIENLNLSFPKELYDLYSWHNGAVRPEQIRLGLLWMFFGGIFFPLERTVQTYIARVNKDEYWKNKMFPVFGSGGGDFYLMDLDEESCTYKQLFYYSLTATEYDVIISCYDSLDTALLTFLECFLEKAFYFNGDTLEVEPNLRARIGRSLNPLSEYWTLFQ